jgi:DNA-binding PadR family transcriptional regulator
MRRGNVRAAILALLTEQPMHGYQMIQELSRRSGGAWTPSPGSIYPTLQMLEDEGLVTSHQSPDGKRLFEITDTGRAEAARAGGTGRPPWEHFATSTGAPPIDLIMAIRDAAVGVAFVATQGTDEQRAQVVSLLAEFRRQLSTIVPNAPSGRPGAFRPRSGPFGGFGFPGWLFGPTGGPGSPAGTAGSGPFGPWGFWGSNDPTGAAEPAEGDFADDDTDDEDDSVEL